MTKYGILCLFKHVKNMLNSIAIVDIELLYIFQSFL
jgi:hypothetical protein